jgi:hypothetical protein
MAEIKEEHFEVIDSNKAKAYEEQKSMRQELVRWIESCETRHMHELYSEMKTNEKRSGSNGIFNFNYMYSSCICGVICMSEHVWCHGPSLPFKSHT